MSICFQKNISASVVCFILCLCKTSNSSPTTQPFANNFVILTTRLKNGNSINFSLNVEKCIWLEQSRINGVLVSIQFQLNNTNKCVEIHKEYDCKGAFLPAKPDTPAIDKLYRWNLNEKHSWIDVYQGAKAVGPCREKCHRIEIPEKNDIVQVSFFTQKYLQGKMADVTVIGCKVIPKPLRNRVASLITNSSFCIELHEMRNCSGASIEIPSLVPFHLTRDLEDWGFSSKTLSVSLCGFNCPNAQLLKERSHKVPKDSFPGKVKLYAEPNFEGKKKTLHLQGLDCLEIPINWRTTTESIQTYDACFDLFKNKKCNRDENGNVLHLNNSKDGLDLIQLGWADGIKSIAPCFQQAEKSFSCKWTLSFLIVMGFVVAFLAIIIFLLAWQICVGTAIHMAYWKRHTHGVENQNCYS